MTDVVFNCTTRLKSQNCTYIPENRLHSSGFAPLTCSPEAHPDDERLRQPARQFDPLRFALVLQAEDALRTRRGAGPAAAFPASAGAGAAAPRRGDEREVERRAARLRRRRVVGGEEQNESRRAHAHDGQLQSEEKRRVDDESVK